MKTAFTIEVDTDRLAGLADSYLAAMWHTSQLNPAPDGDRDAEDLVQSISTEIVRRWLSSAPPLLYERPPGRHHWQTLVNNGSWSGPGGAWQPDFTKMARQAAQQVAQGGAV